MTQRAQKMNKSKHYNSVSEYYNNQSIIAKRALLELKDCILCIIPNTEELLNYNIPAYTLKPGGKRSEQILIAANKNSIGFYPHPTTIEKFNSHLTGYSKGKGSVQFPLDQPLPKKLIFQMIKYRLDLLSKS